MLIGIDDTDSPHGGCTTHIAALLTQKLKTNGYPKLIRLNPNNPHKTRGNAAVALEVTETANTREETLKLVKKHSRTEHKNTDPGVVFLTRKEKNNKILQQFYQKTLTEYIELSEAEKIAKRVGAETHTLKTGRGIIGALAALGACLNEKTYELIAYRHPINYKRKRKIDAESIRYMNRVTYPKTFDNIDPETGKIQITPAGNDPILCGIRGVTPQAVTKAWSMLKPLESVTFTQIFESNQATDAHLRPRKIKELRPCSCAILSGVVDDKPKTFEGGHVFFGLSDKTGAVACAAYRPTGDFRKRVAELLPGDAVRVFGGVSKYPATFNLERLEVVKLVESFDFSAPTCCRRKMTSAGSNKGYKCRLCGKRKSPEKAVKKEVTRSLSSGFYEVPPRARRHLVRPLVLGI